jgi:hypothetical protein
MKLHRSYAWAPVAIGSALAVGTLLFPSTGSGQVAGPDSPPKQPPNVAPARQRTAERLHAAPPVGRDREQRPEGRRLNARVDGSQGDHPGDRRKPPGGQSAPDQHSGIRPSQLFQDRFDLRPMSWGDGFRVPTSGKKLVILGIDNHGLLHIRIFGAGGKSVMDTDETRLFDAHAVAIASLKHQLPGLLAPHVLTGAEKARVMRKVTLILAQTSQDSQRQLRQGQPHQRPKRSRTARSGSGRDTDSSPNPGRSTEEDAG